MPEPIVLSWSGGKDSAMSLRELIRGGQYTVVSLLTTINEEHDRISMHGVRRVLLERQADSLGLPLEQIGLPNPATNEVYESRIAATLARYQQAGITQVAFGDIFLEDLRVYRERNLARIGMRGVFPIWKRSTPELVQTFLAVGFRAIAVCVDTKALDPSFAGRELDQDFFAQLPAQVDPCGENGEFHSFVFAGPIFRERVAFTVGERVMRDGFCFCDLVPL